MSKQSILITGCSTGIGYCVAHGLQQRGHQVIASCRQQQDVDRLQQEGLTCIQLDLNNSSSIESALEQTIEITGGTLDALFNNGAYGMAGAVEDLSREALREQFETNLFGWVELTNLILPMMREQGHGRVIYNSSVLGFIAFPYRGAYSASKFALEGLVDTLRMELDGSGISLSLIEPGPIKSDFRANAQKAFKKHIDSSNSYHQQNYQAMQERFNKPGNSTGFTLGPEAVLERVIHALESNNPKPRYYVTKPTYLFGYLKRFLSTRQIDRLMLKVSDGGKR